MTDILVLRNRRHRLSRQLRSRTLQTVSTSLSGRWFQAYPSTRVQCYQCWNRMLQWFLMSKSRQFLFPSTDLFLPARPAPFEGELSISSKNPANPLSYTPYPSKLRPLPRRQNRHLPNHPFPQPQHHPHPPVFPFTTQLIFSSFDLYLNTRNL